MRSQLREYGDRLARRKHRERCTVRPIKELRNLERRGWALDAFAEPLQVGKWPSKRDSPDVRGALTDTNQPDRVSMLHVVENPTCGVQESRRVSETATSEYGFAPWHRSLGKQSLAGQHDADAAQIS